MKTKKSFVNSAEVANVAIELEACLKICHKIYIDWIVLANYLWKNEETRKNLQAGHKYNMEEISILGKNLVENFTKYFVVKLK